MITVNNLTKSYPEFSLGIENIVLENNRIYSLLGKNGAGKTTFIKCLMNLIDYDGEILFDNQRMVEQRQEILQNVGYVDEKISFNNDLDISFYFKFMRTIYKTWDEKTYNKIIKSLDFEKHLNKKIGELSRGNELKASLIATLSHHPKYIILDEPTSGLDIAVRESLLNTLREFSSSENTILFSTHIIEDIEQISTDIILIDNGELVISSTKSELFNTENSDSISEIVKKYISI